MRAGAVEFDHRLGRESKRDERGDDRARAGAADIVEVVREHQVAAAELFAQQRLDPGEELERDQPADSAAVDREQFLRSGRSDASFKSGLRVRHLGAIPAKETDNEHH